MDTNFKPNSPLQKAVAISIAIIAITLLYFLLPPLVFFFKNLILLGVLVLIVGVMAVNYKTLWILINQLAWSVTKKAISVDKLGFMYQYVDYLKARLEKIKTSIEETATIKTKLKRDIESKKNDLNSFMNSVVELQKFNADDIRIGNYASKISVINETLGVLEPQYNMVLANETNLKELYVILADDMDKLKFRLDAKAKEYEMLKITAEATGNAKEFLNGNSQDFKIYQESLKQIENSVSNYIAKVDQFDFESKTFIQNSVDSKQEGIQQGLKMVEEFKKNSLKL